MMPCSCTIPYSSEAPRWAQAWCQEADLAAAISKYNKILTQQPQHDRQVLKLRLDHDRMPVAPQILATGGARPDLGQRTRLERRRPIVISAVEAGAALPRLVVHRMIPP